MPASIITSFIFLAVSAATSPTSHPVSAAESRITANLKTVAVIAGSNKNINLLAAELLSKSLAKNAGLQVLSPAEVSRKLPDYPYNIRGPFGGGYFNSSSDFGNTDVPAVKRIKEKLGVDYLYVVWMSSAITNTFGQTTLTFLSQLFGGPNSSLGDSNSFESSAWGGISCCLSFQEPDDEEQFQKLTKDCERYGRDMAKTLDRLIKDSASH